MAARKKKAPAPPPSPEPKVRVLEGYGERQTPDPERAYLRRGPSAFNSFVNVYRYRVTVERIEEPDEVIVERLLTIYRTSDNYHDREAAHAHAKTHFAVDLSVLADERRKAEKKAAESA